VEDVATELLTEWVDHESSAGRYSAYLARPAPVTAPMPGVVVIQEVWGLDAHIRNVAERFATAGYGALAPDSYSAGGARPPALAVDRVEAAQAFLDSIPPAEWMGVLGDKARRAEALSRLPGDQGRQVGETRGALSGRTGDESVRHLGVLRARFPTCGPTRPVAGGRAARRATAWAGGCLRYWPVRRLSFLPQ
jgi:hypothetical protein